MEFLPLWDRANFMNSVGSAALDLHVLLLCFGSHAPQSPILHWKHITLYI